MTQARETTVAAAQQMLEPDERVLSTLNRDGSRRWLRPRVSPGRFLWARLAVAWVLIAVFIAIPHLRAGGKPLILLDIVRREFTLFGYTFLPTDTLLLALLMVGLIVSIFLATAMLGRVWCGWICPQTVYMEFVYRPLERLFDGRPGRGGKLARRPAAWRTVLKLLLFLGMSVVLANTFLAYFVGVDALSQWVRHSPYEHPTPFLVMAATTALMMFNFSYFREQTCILCCPYGRFQSVMLDRNSLIISYDSRRGEPRGPVAAKGGDCIDCGLCVETCPTGIDIRDGLQMECVGCAQCIDACDAVMGKIKRPRGLIRYSSQARMAGESGRLLRPRVVLYPLVLAVLATAFIVLFEGKKTTDVTVLRGLGRPFVVMPDGKVANQLRLKITNRGKQPASYEIELVGLDEAKLIIPGGAVTLKPGQSFVEAVNVVAPDTIFRGGIRDAVLRVSDGAQFSQNVAFRLLGPAASDVPSSSAGDRVHG